MALSLPAVYVTSTSFCQVLCSHFLLAAFTTVPWISFITLVYGCGKQKKRMMDYSLLPLALQRLFQSPSTCGCFVGWVFNCYSGSNLQCSSRESGGLLGLIRVWGAPSLGSYRRRVPQAPPPGTSCLTFLYILWHDWYVCVYWLSPISPLDCRLLVGRHLV